MTLTKEDYAALYDEMTDVNEENVQGEFYVKTLEELKHQAIEFLKNEYNYDEEDLEDIELETRWKGEGLYCFWGLGFTNDYCVAHITEIFETETGVDYRIFLGDEKVIEQKKQELLNEDNFVYAIYKVFGFNDVSLVKVVYSDVPLNDKEVYEELESIGYAQSKHDDGCWINHSIQEIREMDNQEFYQFLKDYEKLLYS
jgi:hypothetical protein